MPEPLLVGGIVLCGGRSLRMGRSKAWLPFGHEPSLSRVVRIVRSVVSPVVVVAGPIQNVPSLPEDVRLLRDEEEYLGPLAGLGLGLMSLQHEVGAAFVAACDVPLLLPEFIQLLIDRLEDHDAAVVFDGRHYYGVVAVYRTRLAGLVRRLVASRQLRLRSLFDRCDVRSVELEEVRAVDPDLRSLRNINTIDEYREALQVAGLPPGREPADSPRGTALSPRDWNQRSIEDDDTRPSSK